MEFGEFVTRLDNPHEMPSGTSARCPAHDDKVASLMVNEGEHGGIVVRCHAGCTADAVVKSMGLALSDLMGAPHKVADYSYTTEDGVPLYTVERWANPKTFRGFLPEPAHRVLYNLPAVKWARENGANVYFVEGEKDVDALAKLGVPATTNPTGAGPGKWFPHYSDQLTGCHVIVVADNDAVGRAHARTVGASLIGKALSTSLMVPRYGNDVGDLLAGGYSLANGLDLLAEVDSIGVFRADAVKPKKVTWAWHRYFAFGKLAIIEGDPGDGKSILTLDLAARWSRGLDMPDGTNGYGGPLNVLLVSAEDDPEDTLRPRLDAAGADLTRIHLITYGSTPSVPFELSTGLPALQAYVMANGINIVFLDPLNAFLDASTDSKDDKSVRHALQPLRHMAAVTHTALGVVRHLNKGGAGVKALYRGNGSIGFIGAARTAFLVAEDRSDPSVRILACNKSNLTRKPPALRYAIESSAQDVPFIAWKGVVDVSAQQLLDGPEHESVSSDEVAAKRRAVAAATEFLLDVLRDGPMPWADIKAAGKDEGYSEITLRRARDDNQDKVEKIIGSGGARDVTWRRVVPPDPYPSPFDPSAHPKGDGSAIQNGEQTDQTSKREPEPDYTLSPDGTTAAERDADLDAMPLVCAICRSTEAVSRYFAPYWVVRCDSHDPQLEDVDQ